MIIPKVSNQLRRREIMYILKNPASM